MKKIYLLFSIILMHSNLFCHLTEYTINCFKKKLNENNIEGLRKILDCRYLTDNDRLCLLMGIDNKSSWGLLHYAVIHDFFDSAEFLMSRMNDLNISVNVLDEYKNTPLHFAAMRGNIKIAKLLIENGADINCKNRQKETPLDKAEQCGYGYRVQELKDLFEEIENFKCMQKMFDEDVIDEFDEDSDDETEVYYSSENEEDEIDLNNYGGTIHYSNFDMSCVSEEIKEDKNDRDEQNLEEGEKKTKKKISPKKKLRRSAVICSKEEFDKRFGILTTVY